MKHLSPQKIICLVFIAIILISSASKADENIKFGSLSIFSKVSGIKVYIDDEFAGKPPIEIEKIQVGTHLVTATLGNKIIYEEVIKIIEGELTTLVITGKKTKQKTEENEKETHSDQAAPLFLGGPYFKIGYMTSIVYSLDHGDSYYSSTLGYGGGYKLSFMSSPDMPSVDINLSVQKGDFVSGSDSWYLMPIMLGITFNYPIIPGFGGKQYMALGFGYIITNIRIDGDELSTVGYSFVPYGMEFPVADHGSVFIETTSTYAENGKHKYAIETFSISGGMRWLF